jgi:hypothetical protein
VHIGAVDAGASVQELAFSADGSTLYAAAGGAGIQVWSLDDPVVPRLIETLDRPYSVISVDTGGDLLWAVDQQDVVAVDVADPRVPVVLNAHRTTQWSMHVAASETRAWVADWGWLSGYRAVGDPVGDVNPSSRKVYVAPGSAASIQLANPGGDEVVVSGVRSSDARVQWAIDDGRIPAGGSRTLTLTLDGEATGLSASICIASSDPDTPTQELLVVSNEDGGRAGVGIVAPDFELADLDGDTHRLSDLRGRPVVLAYFATW